MNPGGAPPAGGVLGARRRLPSGRAVAGGFAVATAAVLVFGAYLGTRPRTGNPAVVAARTLAAGTRLTAGDLRTVDVHLPAAVAAGVYRAPGALAGRILAVGLDDGALVTSAELVPASASPAIRPVPVTVPAVDMVDLATGEDVDVLVTEGSAPQTHTVMVVRGAEVLTTAQPAGGLDSSSGGDVVTLGVASLAEVEAVVSAEHAGTLDVVVGEPSDGSGLGASGGSGT